MGYMKIVQFGNITEIYEYEKPIANHKERHVSQLTKKRQKQARLARKARGLYERSPESIKKSKLAFFRLCHHNNCNSDTIHFVTLTFTYDLSIKEARGHVKRFMERTQKAKPDLSLRYISVPELTKKGRFHFHLLVYDLPPETAELERKTRNFQRLFQRGFVDISLATYNSVGIAGYMAKYMAKALTDFKDEAARGFTSSRNIKKITSAGSNTLSGYTDMIVPTDRVANVENRQYDVKYLGKCRYTKITTIL